MLAVGRDMSALERMCREMSAAGGRAEPCAADVTSADGPRAIVAAAVDRLGGVDALVNAAGVIASGSVIGHDG